MEPWELKTGDKRTEDGLTTFVIFCEDEVSEPVYFKYFETNKIKVNTIGGQKSKLGNVMNAINHCIKESLMTYSGGKSFLNTSDVHVWCVFDMDIDKSNPKNHVASRTAFDESIQLAEAKGIKIAWSNDSFELWILLHFEDVDPGNLDHCYRQHYYDRLTSILIETDEPVEELQRLLVYPDFNYKHHLKSPSYFRSIMRPEMIKRTNDAITRSQKLSENFKAADTPPHQCVPCTQVHELVLALQKAGR